MTQPPDRRHLDPPRIVHLDDVRMSGAVAGAKATALAQARRRGLPVLPGFVVAPDAGRALVAAALSGCSGLSGGQGAAPHAAVLEVMEAAARVDLVAAVAAARGLGPRLVVRSSSPVEDDPVWAGAFSSLLDVAPDELPAAVAGCWASSLTPAVLERCARTGAAPAEVCPAALVQPMVEPQAGGTARILQPSREAGPPPGVEVVGVRGSPAPLLAGWTAGDDLPPEWIREVEQLARRAAAGGAVTIEWAIVEDAPVLLQVRAARPPSIGCPPSASRPPSQGRGRPRGRLRGRPDPVPPSLARALARYGGPLGDELVLAWMLAPSDRVQTPAHDLAHDLAQGPRRTSEPPARCGVDGDHAAEEDPVAGFDRTAADARVLVAEAVGVPDDDARRVAAVLLGRVAAGDLGALASLHPVGQQARDRVLAGFEACARHLTGEGALAHDEQLWSLSADEVRARLVRPLPTSGPAGGVRRARWQAVIGAAVAGAGRPARGQGAAPGWAVGWGRRLASEGDLRQVVPGDVVVVERPFPQAAPALWAASALVAESGSLGAHLIDVARSLRVPAVVAAGPVEGVEVGAAGTLVLVDGDHGTVGALKP